MQVKQEDATVNHADAIKASKRLARALKESPAYQRHWLASERLKENADANRLFAEYQRAVQAFESNDIIAEYIAAREDLIQMLQEANAAVSERLGIDFARLAKPAKGCC